MFKEIALINSEPRIGFENVGGGSWKIFDRYMTVDGKRVMHLGNYCSTCHFFFERYETRGTSDFLTADHMSARLEEGSGLMDEDLVRSIGRIFPSGKYVVWNGPVQPRFVVPGGDDDYFQHDVPALWENLRDDPAHDPGTPYFRGHSRAIGNGQLLLEFLIPFQDIHSLDQSRIEHYERLIDAGKMPTALAVSIVDIANPNEYELDEAHDYTIHWTIAHYLLDGHHKIAAAARTGTSCGLLSFASVDGSVVVIPTAVTDAIRYRDEIA